MLASNSGIATFHRRATNLPWSFSTDINRRSHRCETPLARQIRNRRYRGKKLPPQSCSPASTGFHHTRLAASPAPSQRRQLSIRVREAETDGELWSCSVLRARSFYVYPPERAFAGQLHQNTMAKEEYSALVEVRDQRSAGQASVRSACLIATAARADCPEADKALLIRDADEVVAGSLDLCNVRAMAGEVLIGDSTNIAYLANVCVAEAARRCGVGGQLLITARELANTWGVDDLMVHIMAVNTSALRFYESHGFAVIKEETADAAHHRGHCLDGISGGGRTLLLADQRLHADSVS